MTDPLTLTPPQSPGLPQDSLELMKENAAAAAKLMRVLGNDSRLLILCYLDGK